MIIQQKNLFGNYYFPLGEGGLFTSSWSKLTYFSSVSPSQGTGARLITAGQGAVIRGQKEILLWRAAGDQVPKKGIGSKWGYTLRFQEACSGCGKSRDFSS